MLEPPPHRQTFGPYEVEGPLGRGGMGVVYAARHRETGQRVAVKTVILDDPRLTAGIRREILCLSRLHHPGVVGIVADGVQDAVPWYAMELVDGRPLEELGVGGSTRQDIAPVLSVIRRLCSPLAYLHGEGVVHRDLRPANVLVRADGLPVIVDFGLTTSFAGGGGRESLEVAAAVGTLVYMAPEVLAGELADARADLYSLGCLLYRLVTGQLPYRESSVAGLIRARNAGEPAPPSSLNGGVPRDLDELVSQLLALRAEDRMGFADDVDRALFELGVDVERPPGSSRTYVYRPPFAGRDAASRRLEDDLARVDEGHGAVVLVTGESGVGKTRFAMEVAQRARRRGFHVIAGECSHQLGDGGKGPPLEAFRGALRAFADVRDHGEPSWERCRGALAAYEPTLQAAMPAQAAARWPEAGMAVRSDDEERHVVLGAIETVLRVLTRHRPLVLILDDIQWADDLTLDTLAGIDRRLDEWRLPVLVLATFRTEEAQSSLARLASTLTCPLVELQRLDERSVAAIVEGMLALRGPAPALVSWLDRHTEGNPFYVAEYLRAAATTGLLVRDGEGRWRADAILARDADGLALPSSLRDLLLRRLATLSPLGRQVVDLLSVIGREASSDVVRQALGVSEARWLEATQEALAKQVLHESPATTLRFIHDKLREVAHSSIDRADRATLHRRVADAMEACAPTRSDAHLAILGHHREMAGESAKALRCYREAGRNARAEHALGEAERLYRAYLSLADGDDPTTIDARIELGEHVLQVRGRTAEAIAEHERALASAERLGDRSRMAASLSGLAWSLLICGRTEESLDVHRESLDQYRAVGDASGEAHVLGSLASTLMQVGRMTEARAHYEDALRIHGETDDEDGVASVLNNLGTLCLGLGKLAEARSFYDRALAIDRRMGHLRHECTVITNLAIMEGLEGRTEAAQSLFESALRASRESGDRRSEGNVLGNLAVLCQQLGTLEHARSLLGEAIEIHQETGDRRSEAVSLGNLADLDRLSGDLELAAARIVSAEQMLAEVQDPLDLAPIVCIRGRIVLATGESARDLLDRATAIARGVKTEPGSQLLRDLERLERAQRAFDEGRELICGEDPADIPDVIASWLAVHRPDVTA